LRGGSKTLASCEFATIAAHTFLSGEAGRDVDTKEDVVDALSSHGYHMVVREQDHRPWVRDHVHGRRTLRGRGDEVGELAQKSV